MREFTKSLFSFSLAVSMFGLKQVDNLFRPAGRDERKGPASKSFDSLTAATTDQFGETLKATFRAADNLQRGIISMTFDLMFPFVGIGTRRSHRSGLETTPDADPGSASEPQRWVDVMERSNSRL